LINYKQSFAGWLEMKNEKIIMPFIGIALAAVFIGSVVTDSLATQKNLLFESKKVTSISEIAIPAVPDIKPENDLGVVTAEQWAPYYPDIYASHERNKDNVGDPAGRIKYTETNPDITVIYQGMGFSFDYTEAIGHSYTLDDIAETTRPHKLANCLTCKSPDMAALVNKMGTEAYRMDFDTAYAMMEEPVSCYTCHANEPGTINIVHDYAARAWSDEIEAKKVNAIDVSCGQCHIEYYFDPETKATMVPYDSKDGIAPDAILAVYNEMGFSDYTNANTGVGMIKVQHPEFETYYGKGSQHVGMYTCADCHMYFDYNEKTAEPYVVHEFTSPLNNSRLLNEQCSLCHKDLKSEVAAIQKHVTDRENEISAMLVDINTKLAAAIENGSLDEETIAKIKSLDRDAQFYWDFVFVENSEGAHNSKLSDQCLDKAEALAKEALDLL